VGDKSKIEWTDATWNTVYGCTRVSAGCDNCYAVKVTQRLAGSLGEAWGLVSPGKKHFNGTVALLHKRLDQPLRWKKPRRIFVNSLSDLFHPDVPLEFVDKVFAVMALCSRHTFQVLTKRPERMREYMIDPATPFRVAKAMDWMSAQKEIETLKEEWRDIPGFPGYRLSNHGHAVGPKGELSPDIGALGHSRITIYRNRERHRFLLHRLILSVFVRKPKNGEQVRHRSGDPACNALPSLSWGSQEENWEDSKRHGFYRRYQKLSELDVEEIKSRGSAGEASYSIAKDFPVSDTQVGNILRGNQWDTDSPMTWPPPKIWLGTSVENQKTANERIPHLLQTPAAIRWLSVEPMLGPVDLTGTLGEIGVGLHSYDVLRGRNVHHDDGNQWTECDRIQWVACGCESGPNARIMDVGWVRNLRDKCDAAGVPFFLKQMMVDGKLVKMPELDGKVWDEYPEVAR